MGIIDQVTGLQKRGATEQQIINQMEEEGYSPKEIKDALNTAQIKGAVSKESEEGEMQPSIMSRNRKKETGKKGYYDDDLDAPKPLGSMSRDKKSLSKTREIDSEFSNANQEQESDEVYEPMPQYSQYPQENQGYGYEEAGYNYPPQEEYQGYSYTDTDTMIEVSEQVFAEKLKPHLKKIEGAIEFKTLAETKLENLSDRLSRIEAQIDKLQAAILEKVGDYGRGLEGVKKEIGMIEESFGKIVRKLEKPKAHQKHKEPSHKKTSAKNKFPKKSKTHSKKR